MEISARNNNDRGFYALIAAAGSGSRIGGNVPKQYQKIAGKMILRHTIEKFMACKSLLGLRVIIDPAYKDLYEEAVAGLDLMPAVQGGKERNTSIYKGLGVFSNLKKEDIVALHDAARPLVAVKDIENVVARACESRAATLARRIADTLKYGSGDYVDRQDLWAIQTPQAFYYEDIMRAHEHAQKTSGNYTDDTSVVAAIGIESKMVEASAPNFKITTQDDMMMAERLLNTAMQVRTGFGYDVHAFDANAEGPVILCGVEIPHTHKLKGHSDADAGLHAITDAVLGTIGGGDIGQHFPPSDPQWKGKDSSHFLIEALSMLEKAGGKVNNIDLTLICEAPKIGPHRDSMQSRIAKICALPSSSVNVKATTTESLGALGRGEGIAAQAVVTVSVPETLNVG